MKSVVERIGTTEFARVRVGIGRPSIETDKMNYVIGRVTPEEYRELEVGIEKAKEAITCMLEKGYDTAMNVYNERKKGESCEGNCNNKS